MLQVIEEEPQKFLTDSLKKKKKKTPTLRGRTK